MYTYCIGTNSDIDSTISIDYEAYLNIIKNYQPRKYIDMLCNFNKKPNGLILAKDKNNDTVGFIYTRRLGVLGWCGPMAVLPTYGNKGIGTRLLLEAENLLKEEGCETIGFETTPDLMNYYLKKSWIATGITYFFSYSITGNEIDSHLCTDEIILKEKSKKELNNINEFVNMQNGVDFATEIITDIDLNKSKFCEIFIDRKIKGVILFELKDDLINIKMMNLKINKLNDFYFMKKIFDAICRYFNKNTVVFSINTQYSELLVSVLNNSCKVKGYSIRFQGQNSKIINYENMVVSYHWGT